MIAPPCIKCRKSKRVVVSGDRNYYCADCKIEFDPADDGDYSDKSPAARLERADRERQRRMKR